LQALPQIFHTKSALAGFCCTFMSNASFSLRFAACLPWCLSTQPQRTVFLSLPLASRRFCFRLARDRFRCEYRQVLRFASGCLCSDSFAHLFFWRLRTTLNRKFVSAFDQHSLAARGRPISTVPSSASRRCHPFWHVATLHCS